MGNIYKKPEKLDIQKQLLNIAVQSLENIGWKVERVRRGGKPSIRRITKDGQSKIISIRTSRNTQIAFQPINLGTGWKTLDEVDAVVAVSVDDKTNPKFAKVHFIDGNEMRDRFNRAYAAKKKAGHAIPDDQGIWLSLYHPETNNPITCVGAGAGLKFPPIATVPLIDEIISALRQANSTEEVHNSIEESPLSISEAKRRLAKTLGINPENIKIIIES